jgi:hypothetical protein
VASPNTALPRRPVALMLTALQAGQCMQADQGRRGPGCIRQTSRHDPPTPQPHVVAAVQARELL